MSEEEILGGKERGKVGAQNAVNAAEKALLEANGRCTAESRDEVRLAERFLGIARRRFILQDWDEARLFGRLAMEWADRATHGTGMGHSATDQHHPS